MATTTTNFGWDIPQSTDLVKDGATAIAALGQDIDTALVDLKGGTTGQVLAKASNTDLDYSWVAQDDSNAIQNAIVDAKGDLIAASAADTPARLAVGANGETLVADSSTSTGLRYQAPVQQNPFLNSAFQVWQRGTSFAVSGSAAYTADRWQAISAAFTAGLTVSRQATNDTTNLPFIQYCARVQRDSGNTSTAARNLQQCFESVNSIPFAGKTVTLSFYARAGANYSATSSLLGTQWVWGTGTDQNLYLAGYTGQTNISATTSVTLTTTWQRFTISGTVGATATEIALNFNYSGVGTAGANDYFEVTGVQMEVGSVATPFHTYAATLQGELAACQRYYFRSSGASIYAAHGTGSGETTTTSYIVVNNPVPLRTNPSSVDFSTLALYDQVNVTAVTNVTIANSNNRTTTVQATVASGLTIYRPYILLNNNNTAGYLGLSAEL
jgi:hypothetical protein